MPFRSKAQWRMAFARGMPWARKWAHESPSFKSLPGHKRGGGGKRKGGRRKGRR